MSATGLLGVSAILMVTLSPIFSSISVTPAFFAADLQGLVLLGTSQTQRAYPRQNELATEDMNAGAQLSNNDSSSAGHMACSILDRRHPGAKILAASIKPLSFDDPRQYRDFERPRC